MTRPSALEARMTRQGHERLQIGAWTVWMPPAPEEPSADSRMIERESLIASICKALVPIPGKRSLHVLLTGPVGSGKSSLVELVARRLNKPLYTLVCRENTTDEQLVAPPFGVGTADDIAETHFSASPLLCAVLNGGILFADELDKLPPGASDVLEGLLDERRRRLEFPAGGAAVEAHPDFAFIGAQNSPPEALPARLLDRLRVRITVDPPAADLIARVLQARTEGPQEEWMLAWDDVQRSGHASTSMRQASARLEYAYRSWYVDGSPALDRRSAKEYLMSATQVVP